jgi:hypothetical protein
MALICAFKATYKGELLKIPRYGINRGGGSYENNTVLWTEGYHVRIVNGIAEIEDESGNMVVRDGEKVFLKGKMINPKNSDIALQLSSELRVGMDVNYYRSRTHSLAA